VAAARRERGEVKNGENEERCEMIGFEKEKKEEEARPFFYRAKFELSVVIEGR
jgi:hypothetical protein